MILGIGTDICDIHRIERLLDEKGERFIARTFTEEEQKTAESRKNGGLTAAAYTKRFAAKEACAKALGSAIREGILFTDISVSNDVMGKPSLTLSGKALERLEAITPEGHEARLHLSLSDERPYALAFVTIEAVPIS